MPKNFTALTPHGLVLGTLAELAGSIHFDNFQIDENLTITIRIDDPYFNDHLSIDYRISQIITAVQEDFLGIYNQVTGDHLTLATLRYHPELVIRAKLRQGSIIAEITDAIRVFDTFVSHFSPHERILILRLALGMFAIGCFTRLGTKGLDYLKTAKIEDTKFAIRQLELASEKSPAVQKAIEAAEQNTKTASTVAGLITDTGTLTIGDSQPITGQELRLKVKQKKELDESHQSFPFLLDGLYKIDCQNYDEQTVRIKLNNKSVWASTAHLRPEDREEWKRIMDAAVDQKKAQKAWLRLSVTIEDRKVTKATIEGIGKPRPDSLPLYEALARAEELHPTSTTIPIPLISN